MLFQNRKNKKNILIMFLILFFLLISNLTIYADGENTGYLSENSFVFIHNETEFKIDFTVTIEEIEMYLGESVDGVSKSDLKVSWDEGLHLKLIQRYKLNSSTGEYIAQEGEYIISEISIDSSEFSLFDGISIGDTRKVSVDILGSPYRYNKTVSQYLFNDEEEVWNLLVYFRDDIVEQIKIIRGT